MRKLSKDKTLKALKETGISITEYKRGPLGKYNFSLAKTPSGNGLRVWIPEGTDVEISTNKKKSQAVLRVVEKARKVRNYVDVYIGQFAVEELAVKKESNPTLEKLKEIHNRERNYDLNVNELGTYTFVPNSTFVPERTDIHPAGWGHVRVYGYSKTRKTTTTFLIGVDENKHFVSVLKEHVDTVDEAHQSLRPEGLSDQAVRQGEWFFDPIDEEEELEILRDMAVNRQKFQRSPLEWSSSHSAKSHTYNKQRFAIGKVKDKRRGYHKALELRRLHRVVRNNEVKVDPVVRNYD